MTFCFIHSITCGTLKNIFDTTKTQTFIGYTFVYAALSIVMINWFRCCITPESLNSCGVSKNRYQIGKY